MMESQSTPTMSNGSGFRASSRLAYGLPEGELSAIDAKQVSDVGFLMVTTICDPPLQLQHIARITPLPLQGCDNFIKAGRIVLYLGPT